ncbi:MAG: hypothetical protein JWN98_1707 [Abditibacteriota bacterium]|nr:hypothetical protein [Abditibacteriota bacterium]
MHWLLLLAILSSTTKLDSNGSASNLNRLAENALRQQLGNARTVRVQVVPDETRRRGDFDAFNITLDGFDADALMGLANRTAQNGSTSNRNGSYDRSGNESYFGSPQARSNFDIEDVLRGGNIGGIGDILGGVLGGKGAGRIGRIRLKATNFSMQGTRYAAMNLDFGEVRFDWAKAARGQFDIQSVQPGTLGLTLNADQAVRLLAPRLPSVQGLRVRFANGLAHVGGRADYYGVNVPFEVGGRLTVQQNQVRADSLRASISKLRLPSFVVNELTRGINPLYDFDPQNRWPLSVNLQTAGTQSNALALRGGIQWRGFGQHTRNDPGRDENYDPRYDDGAYDPNPRYPEPNQPQNRPAPRDNRDSTFEDVIGGIFGR